MHQRYILRLSGGNIPQYICKPGVRRERLSEKGIHQREQQQLNERK